MDDRFAAGTNTGDLQSRRTKLVMRTTNGLKNVSSTFASQGVNGDEVCVAVVPKNHACCYQCCLEVGCAGWEMLVFSKPLFSSVPVGNIAVLIVFTNRNYTCNASTAVLIPGDPCLLSFADNICVADWLAG